MKVKVGPDLGLVVPVGTPAKAMVWGFGTTIAIRGLVTGHRADGFIRILVDSAIGDDGKDYWGRLPGPSLWTPQRGVAADDGK